MESKKSAMIKVPVADQVNNPAKIMYDALVRIAHSNAFFDGEKRLVAIARRAIEQVTSVR